MQTPQEIVGEFITTHDIDMGAFNEWFDDAGYPQEEGNIHDSRHLQHLKDYVEQRDEEERSERN